MFALINGVPTVYETLSAGDGKGASAGKSGGKNGGGAGVSATGNGAKGGAKGGAKRQKPDPVRLAFARDDTTDATTTRRVGVFNTAAPLAATDLGVSRRIHAGGCTRVQETLRGVHLTSR